MFWTGRANGPERNVAQEHGFEFHPVSAAGIAGKSLAAKAVGGFRLIQGFCQSQGMLNRLQPDCLIAAGGFVAAAPLFAARLQGRSFFLLEQNRIPGRVTRFFARYARETFLTFPVVGRLTGRQEVTGMPLREGVINAAKRGRQDDGRTVLVLGGSQGARSLNLAALDMAAALSNLHFILITGKRDYLFCQQMVRSKNCELVEWTDHPEEFLARATLAVSRAGGMAISELLAFGIPTVLVPFPYAVDRHQEANARFIADQGAAIVLAESHLSGLVSLVRSLMDNVVRREEMARRAVDLAKLNAAEIITERIERCLAG